MRGFSSSTRRNGYEDTIENLKIGKHTRVIFQGFTGKQVSCFVHIPSTSLPPYRFLFSPQNKSITDIHSWMYSPSLEFSC